MKNIIFHPEAQEELNSSIDFYYSQIDGLGLEFLEEIELSIEKIKEFPERWQKKHNSIRHYLLQQFPFTIFYISEPNCIYIVAISHQKRKPEYWIERI